MDQAVIEVRELRFCYGPRVALDCVSFEVQPRSIFGLLGPNGGGKSTLFRVLCTAEKPSAGRLRIGDCELPRDRHRVRWLLGTVFQSPSLDRKLTVWENLCHHGHLYGLRGRALEKAIHEALEAVGLREEARERVERLSGGMQRRAEVAKALIHRPKILLLDEPTTGLDPIARAILWEYWRRLRDDAGSTILLTTHHFEDAEQCDEIGFLDRGKLIVRGSPEELKASVAGEVLEIESAEPAAVASFLRQRFALEPTLYDSYVRVEHPAAHQVVPLLVDQLGALVKTIRLGPPTLADVFFKYTGHKFHQVTEPSA